MMPSALRSICSFVLPLANFCAAIYIDVDIDRDGDGDVDADVDFDNDADFDVDFHATCRVDAMDRIEIIKVKDATDVVGRLGKFLLKRETREKGEALTSAGEVQTRVDDDILHQMRKVKEAMEKQQSGEDNV